jgi:hypothetical protein
MTNPVVDEYEALYRETRNPLYVWEAFENCQRDEPLPSWVFDYLAGCARSLGALGQPAWDDIPSCQIESRHPGVLDIADAVCAGSLKADDAANLAARALAFKRGAKDNAFADLAQTRKGFREAWHVDVTRAGTKQRAGIKQEAAKAEIEAHIRNDRAPDARNVKSLMSQINRRIARARALWAAQRPTQE